MNGQGRPSTPTQRCCAALPLARAGLALLLVCAGAARSFAADLDDLHLRVAWGGGNAKVWEARISLSEGELTDMRLLGLEPDAAGALARENGAYVIRPTMPRTYDGLDLTARAPLTATLTVELAAAGELRSQQKISVPLAKLVNDTSDSALDATGNRLVVLRAPGDRLRLRTAREHFVFSPAERFTFEIVPYQLGLPADEVLKCEMQLLKARTSEEVWRTDKELLVAAGGELPAIGPIDVDLPDVEGAYDLVVTVRRPGRSRLLPSKVITQRSVQLVVVDPTPQLKLTPDATTTWNSIVEIDPANPKWWDRLTRISGLTLLPGFTKGPLEGGKTSKQTLGEQQYIQLEPQAWQAYPLAVQTPGRPHILEVEFPPGVGQSLGISLVEPNAAGQVTPVGLDSGFDLADAPNPAPNQPGLHRLVFWPKTSSPLVVLTNRRDDRPAFFAHLRVLAGPDHLPPAGQRPAANERLAIAYYNRPLVAPNFSATDALDPAGGRTLDDWVTFLDSATRLAEYLRYAGYNAAVVPVLHEGGTLYPSRVLDATAKHDTGIYFSNGQDPQQKDVVELLFRVFEREGLRLIPAMQFAAPLPELERLRQAGSAADLELRDAEGKTWSERNGNHRALGPVYNPLCPQVQTAMEAVVREFTERYATRGAFAGLALELGPETYAQLPGADWAFDEQTVARFAAETKTNVPQSAHEAFAVRAHALLTSSLPTWLAWRSATLGRFHARLADGLSERRPGAKLLVLPTETPISPVVQERLRPTLPRRASAAEAMAAVGIDPARYAKQENLLFLRPQRASQVTLARQGGAVELSSSPEADTYFAQQGVSGGLCLHEPLPLRLAGFEPVSPFGAKNTYAYFVTQLTDAGPAARKYLIHDLAVHDAQVVAEGGWLLPLGQEAFLTPVLETYRRLPTGNFRLLAEVPATMNLAPVVVRTLERDQQSYVYLVNDSPWAVTVNLELAGSPNLSVAALGPRPLPPLLRQDGRYTWQLVLEPYDLVAGAFSTPGAKITAAQTALPPPVANELREHIRAVRDRAAVLREPPALVAPANFGFESPSKPPDITGWVHKRSLGMSAAVETQQSHSGKQALHLRSDNGVLWVRSAPLAQPRTGRLAVLVWLRTDSPVNQPPLRLAVEGRVNGQTYYRYASVGIGQGATPLKEAWSPFVFQVDDLPYNGLTDLRVGFDLMGRGDVWVDDVTLYDLWFYKTERDELAKLIALADYQFSQGRLVDCQRLLDGYWPRFLETYVPLTDPRVAALPEKTHTPPNPGHESENSVPVEGKAPNLIDRVRGLVPKLPSRF